jgi:hypothetical protein
MPKKSTKKGTDWGGPRRAGMVALDHRHRDKSGRIERKHGNTKVAALRKEYGPSFAEGPAQGYDAEDTAGGNGLCFAA